MTREDGFTLPEVLVASIVGFIVLAAVLGLLESTLRLSGDVMAKTDAMQRGRLAMDRVTQQLRSQICLDVNVPAIESGTDRSVTFYADFGAGDKPVEKRVLELNAGNITERIYADTAPGPPYVFPGTPTRTNTVLENAAQQPGVPFLRYYAFPTNAAVREPTQELAVPLLPASTGRVAKIEVAFVSRPTGANNDKNGVTLRDQVVVRHADPNLATPDPTCA
jgi:type II secretory pathway pseudopilin PulG